MILITLTEAYMYVVFFLMVSLFFRRVKYYLEAVKHIRAVIVESIHL